MTIQFSKMKYQDLQLALKDWRNDGYELQVKLNSKKAVLVEELNRIVCLYEEKQYKMTKYSYTETKAIGYDHKFNYYLIDDDFYYASKQAAISPETGYPYGVKFICTYTAAKDLYESSIIDCSRIYGHPVAIYFNKKFLDFVVAKESNKKVFGAKKKIKKVKTSKTFQAIKKLYAA